MLSWCTMTASTKAVPQSTENPNQRDSCSLVPHNINPLGGSFGVEVEVTLFAWVTNEISVWHIMISISHCTVGWALSSCRIGLRSGRTVPTATIVYSSMFRHHCHLKTRLYARMTCYAVLHQLSVYFPVRSMNRMKMTPTHSCTVGGGFPSPSDSWELDVLMFSVS